jgi:hypothetical protein
MNRRLITVITIGAFLGGQAQPAWAQRSRGSVSSASRGSGAARGNASVSRSGNTTTRQGEHATGSRTVNKTDEGYNVTKQITTDSGASKTVTKDVDVEDREIDSSSTATNRWGESVSREREVEGQGGYATIEGSAKSSTGREMSTDAVAGRTIYGQPAVAGTVNTKYYGTYGAAAVRKPGGGYTAAAVGPYGGRVTTTLPSGYRTTTYYGRPYYAYGGAYYRPYTYRGVAYYYPVPMPYYAYYDHPPVGATMLMVAGVTYLVTKEGSYAKQTTTSSGSVAYQAVPAPVGANLSTLPPERVLVTVSGTTYFLHANTFYKRVPQGAQEQFVVVTAPPGVVFVSALPANFEVVQLNTMYFAAGGKYYVPFLASDGKELYVQVDTPPQPAGGAPAPQAAPQAASQGPPPATAGAPAPAVRAVADSITVPPGTLLVARLATEVSSATAAVGNRFQGFLDQDLAANGKLIAPKGTRVYGVVTAVDKGSKGSGQPSLSVALTDVKVGERVLPIKTQPVTVKGQAGKGGRKVVGGAALGAAIGAIADGGEGAAIGAAIGGGAGAVAAAAGSPTAAVIPAQAAESFTVAAPFQVDLVTNVAVR